jgi:hypothetical protein
MDNSRRTFLQAVVILGGAGVAAQLVGCGDADPETDAGTDAGGGGTDTGTEETDAGGGGTDSGTEETDAGGGGGCTTPEATIGTNHGHSLVVPIADVTAAADRTYSIRGASAHDHMVTITAAQFGMLADGATLSLTSTSSGHTHSVTVTCA